MGAKDSKPCCITYEEASVRVTESELKRLRDAFKRASTLNGIITKQAFIKEVLGEGVPTKLAEHIFQACGGTQKGITFKDLLCGLVLLTRGKPEEKARFIFCLYANESGTHVIKDEMVKLVQASEGGFVPEAVANCFLESEKVTFDEFHDWLVKYPNATTLTRWLLQEPCSVSLSSDTETPTFYQTLAGVTHLEETDIVKLEKRYWWLKEQSRTGKFDLDTVIPLISSAIPLSLCEGFFNAFDENRDGHIDFKEMACGISAACRGPVAERQKFCFKIFDRDRDGLLSKEELIKMVEALLFVRYENRTAEELESDSLKDVDSDTIVEEILTQHDSNKDGAITLDEYLVWTVGHPLPLDFLNLLFQVCHIVLGLRPATKEEEGEIIRGWLEREERKGMQIGQYWYLVSMEWWRSWHEYINYQPQMSPDGNLDSPSASSPVGSQTGSLKRTKLQKKSSAMEGSVAKSNEDSGIVITSITTFGNDDISTSSESDGSLSRQQKLQQQLSHTVTCSPKKAAGSVLCVGGGGDMSRSSSATPSPTHSPRIGRKPNGSQKDLFLPPQKPGAIDNTSLIQVNMQKVMMLTGEGGKLKRNVVLTRGRDFELVPEPVWNALSQWYGGSPALPRQVILPKNSDTPELELYPVSLRLLRHQMPPARQNPNTWSGMVGGYGASALAGGKYSYCCDYRKYIVCYKCSVCRCVRSTLLERVNPNVDTDTVARPGGTNYAYPPQMPLMPKRYVAYVASFSRLATLKQVFDFLSTRLCIRPEDMRLWHFKDENNMTLLEEEFITLEELGFEDNEQILIEVRNKDQTWPEEMSSIANMKNRLDRKKQVPTEKGVTGLNNLGNTCFMNAALQCVSNTRPLTEYFTSNMHLFELNRTNPHGMKGHIAKRYGDLVQDLWSGASRTIAPLKLRWTIGKYAPRFNGFQQHDSQELLAFLLDGLHEDLNRVHDKPYLELKDSDGRPDVQVAQEAWENHILRNKSIIVDLFHGQLKSAVTCKLCGHESVRFDPFNYLSLPLPMESCIHTEIVVFRLDGSTPIKYGLRLNMDEKYRTVKQQLGELCVIPASQLLLAEISGAVIKGIPPDDQKIKTMMMGQLYAYEVPILSDFLTTDDLRPTTKEPQTLTQIQRMTLGNASISNAMKKLGQPDSKTYKSNCSPSEGIDRIMIDYESSTSDGSTNGDIPVQSGDTMQPRRNQSSSLLCSMTNSAMTSSMISNSSQSDLSENLMGFLIAYHRKMIRQDVYFLSSQKTRVSLFGLPLVLPYNEMTTQQDLYQAVWIQVSRLVSPLPPSEASVPNHAQDCDDSLGYEYPFTLKAVQKDGIMCAWCPWHRFCRGCKIDCTESSFNSSTSFIAIDWDPTALHLRYQESQERVFLDHESVERTRRLQSEPIDLDTCLQAFIKEEELGEDEKYYCSKCKEHQLASKKLQIWRLPPILIIHLKRFQFVNGRWIKSQKIVKFPFRDFDLTNYLAATPQHTVLQHQLIKQNSCGDSFLSHESRYTSQVKNVDNSNQYDKTSSVIGMNFHPIPNGNIPQICKISTTQAALDQVPLNNEQLCHKTHESLVSSELLSTEILQDFHQHRLKSGKDPYSLKYQLYAISCHSGILGGGHYICYAANANNRWYCYNDSSCKEVSLDQIDSDSAYMLFYERDGIDYEQYMPNVEGKVPDTRDIDDEFESDFKKLCTLQ